MFLSLSDVLLILEQYRYWLIFPVMVLEGPIITVISGLLVYVGLLNFYVTYLLLVIADLTGDALHYAIGRYWQSSTLIKKYGRFIGYNEKSEEYIIKHYEKHKIKTFIIAKISHGMGTAIQITAGIAKVDFIQYLWINLAGTIPKTLIFLLLGFYMGGSYEKINQYLNSTALVIIGVVLLISLYLLSRKIAKNYFKKIV